MTNKGKPTVAMTKGMRDYHPKDMYTRNELFQTIENVYKKYSAQPIDTPVLELKETLTGKYGEDSKLIYELNDQGGQLLAMRYDLTVPFARYLAMYGITKMKRYHIAKVYRRDQPNMNRGRYREFFQCDYDCAGEYKTRLPDAECLKMMSEIMNALAVGRFTIKLSHRGLLDGFFEIAGVPGDKIRTISSAVDKLDKESWEDVRLEMLAKGLNEDSCDRIKRYVTIKGQMADVLAKVKADNELMANEKCRSAIEDLTQIMTYTDIMSCTDDISFDLSLARGLDYYTGIIYECVLLDKNVGTVIAGGRYDNLIGMFSGKRIPAVGFSVGVDRLMSALDSEASQSTETQITVVYKRSEDVNSLLTLCGRLRSIGFKVSTDFDPYESRRGLKKRITDTIKAKIPLLCIIGEIQGKIALKNIRSETQTEHSEVEDLIVAIKSALF